MTDVLTGHPVQLSADRRVVTVGQINPNHHHSGMGLSGVFGASPSPVRTPSSSSTIRIRPTTTTMPSSPSPSLTTSTTAASTHTKQKKLKLRVGEDEPERRSMKRADGGVHNTVGEDEDYAAAANFGVGSSADAGDDAVKRKRAKKRSSSSSKKRGEGEETDRSGPSRRHLNENDVSGAIFPINPHTSMTIAESVAQQKQLLKRQQQHHEREKVQREHDDESGAVEQKRREGKGRRDDEEDDSGEEAARKQRRRDEQKEKRRQRDAEKEALLIELLAQCESENDSHHGGGGFHLPTEEELSLMLKRKRKELKRKQTMMEEQEEEEEATQLPQKASSSSVAVVATTTTTTRGTSEQRKEKEERGAQRMREEKNASNNTTTAAAKKVRRRDHSDDHNTSSSSSSSSCSSLHAEKRRKKSKSKSRSRSNTPSRTKTAVTMAAAAAERGETVMDDKKQSSHHKSQRRARQGKEDESSVKVALSSPKAVAVVDGCIGSSKGGERSSSRASMRSHRHHSHSHSHHHHHTHQYENESTSMTLIRPYHSSSQSPNRGLLLSPEEKQQIIKASNDLAHHHPSLVYARLKDKNNQLDAELTAMEAFLKEKLFSPAAGGVGSPSLSPLTSPPTASSFRASSPQPPPPSSVTPTPSSLSVLLSASPLLKAVKERITQIKRETEEKRSVMLATREESKSTREAIGLVKSAIVDSLVSERGGRVGEQQQQQASTMLKNPTETIPLAFKPLSEILKLCSHSNSSSSSGGNTAFRRDDDGDNYHSYGDDDHNPSSNLLMKEDTFDLFTTLIESHLPSPQSLQLIIMLLRLQAGAGSGGGGGRESRARQGSYDDGRDYNARSIYGNNDDDDGDADLLPPIQPHLLAEFEAQIPTRYQQIHFLLQQLSALKSRQAQEDSEWEALMAAVTNLVRVNAIYDAVGGGGGGKTEGEVGGSVAALEEEATKHDLYFSTVDEEVDVLLDLLGEHVAFTTAAIENGRVEENLAANRTKLGPFSDIHHLLPIRLDRSAVVKSAVEEVEKGPNLIPTEVILTTPLMTLLQKYVTPSTTTPTNADDNSNVPSTVERIRTIVLKEMATRRMRRQQQQAEKRSEHHKETNNADGGGSGVNNYHDHVESDGRRKGAWNPLSSSHDDDDVCEGDGLGEDEEDYEEEDTEEDPFRPDHLRRKKKVRKSKSPDKNNRQPNSVHGMNPAMMAATTPTRPTLMTTERIQLSALRPSSSSSSTMMKTPNSMPLSPPPPASTIIRRITNPLLAKTAVPTALPNTSEEADKAEGRRRAERSSQGRQSSLSPPRRPPPPPPPASPPSSPPPPPPPTSSPFNNSAYEAADQLIRLCMLHRVIAQSFAHEAKTNVFQHMFNELVLSLQRNRLQMLRGGGGGGGGGPTAVIRPSAMYGNKIMEHLGIGTTNISLIRGGGGEGADGTSFSFHVLNASASASATDKSSSSSAAAIFGVSGDKKKAISNGTTSKYSVNGRKVHHQSIEADGSRIPLTLKKEVLESVNNNKSNANSDHNNASSVLEPCPFIVSPQGYLMSAIGRHSKRIEFTNPREHRLQSKLIELYATVDALKSQVKEAEEEKCRRDAGSSAANTPRKADTPNRRGQTPARNRRTNTSSSFMNHNPIQNSEMQIKSGFSSSRHHHSVEEIEVDDYQHEGDEGEGGNADPSSSTTAIFSTSANRSQYQGREKHAISTTYNQLMLQKELFAEEQKKAWARLEELRRFKKALVAEQEEWRNVKREMEGLVRFYAEVHKNNNGSIGRQQRRE